MKPIAILYKKFEEDEDAKIKVVGNICEITSLNVGKELGSAVIRTGGAPIQLNVIHDGEGELLKGEKAHVVRHDKERRIYYITRLRDGMEDSI